MTTFIRVRAHSGHKVHLVKQIVVNDEQAKLEDVALCGKDRRHSKRAIWFYHGNQQQDVTCTSCATRYAKLQEKAA